MLKRIGWNVKIREECVERYEIIYSFDKEKNEDNDTDWSRAEVLSIYDVVISGLKFEKTANELRSAEFKSVATGLDGTEGICRM